MVEAVYNASGLGLPIVMTVANRAIGSPINIWNDHSDSMSQRDSGWIQLYVESNQEAVDLHIQAFRLAEELSLPVMVCMDGFVLTHALRARRRSRRRSSVDAFLPPFEPRQVLDPDAPMTIGAMVGPEAFIEVRYLMHAKQMQALDAIPVIADDFEARVRPRRRAGLVRGYRCEDAETVVVALGSVLGTIEDVVDELRDEGVRDRRARASSASGPWPLDEVRAALSGAQRVVVLEKAFAVGAGGIVGQNVRLALAGLDDATSTTSSPGSAAAPITKASLHALFERGARRTASAACTSSTSTGTSSSASWSGWRAAHAARTPRTCCAISHGGPTDALPADQVLPVGHASWSATACSSPSERSVQADLGRSNAITLGPPRLPGLRRGARRALRARRGDARHRGPADRGQRDRLPGGLLDAVPGDLVAARRGCTRCSATRRRWRPASPPR